MDIMDFALAVELYRERIPCSVTSWGRTEQHNARVGGAPNSKHLHDRAVDVMYDTDVPVNHRVETAANVGLIIRIEPDHDHLETPD